GAAQAERIGLAGGLLFGRVGVTRGRERGDERGERHAQRKCADGPHDSPQAIYPLELWVKQGGMASRGGRKCCVRLRVGKWEIAEDWYSWVGSNHRPPVPQTGALTN